MAAGALKRTPLFPAHAEAGARLTDFGGWDMPLHYGSQIEEHHRVRRDAGMFDVSHMLALDVAGEGAEPFLRQLLANDVRRLDRPGKALYSCLLREDAGILDDLVVYRLAADAFRLVVNAGTAERDLAWVASQREALDADVSIHPRRDLAIIAVQGPQALDKFCQARPAAAAAVHGLSRFSAAAVGSLFVARTGYTGEDGVEVMLPADEALPLWNDLARGGVARCGLGARDTLRLEAGMNLYGQDMDETITPDECGLAWTVALGDDRAFVGRAGLEARAPRFQLLGLVLLDKGVLRSHQRIRTVAGEGEITSGSFAPTLERSIALARLPLACASGERVEVAIRDKWLRAQVVKSPFVRNGKALVPPLA